MFISRWQYRLEKSMENAEKNQYEWPFGLKNYCLFGVALLVIIIGYINLNSSSTNLATSLIIFGHCFLIPMSIIIEK